MELKTGSPTPATALLTLPSANRLLLSAGLRWNPDEPDTPQGPPSARQRSLVLSGLSTPWGLGLGANIQLGRSFQLIPEGVLVASDTGSSNGTLALRWLASPSTYLDLYASSAAGLLDLGTLLPSNQVRVGLRLNVLL